MRLSYNPVRQLGQAIFLCRDWRTRLMAMVAAYFDDSDTAGAAVIAGFVAETDQWIQFSREWSGLLEECQLSGFHMVDYAHSNNEFKDWKGKEKKRREFLENAIGIIRRRVRCPIGIVLDRQEYDRFVNTGPRRAAFGSRYTTACFLSLLMTGCWADDFSEREPIAYFFDDGNPNKGQFQEAFHKLKRDPKLASAYRLGSLTFADDRLINPLQASDFLAYEASKFWTDHKFGLRKPRASCVAVVRGLSNDYMRIVDSSLLRRMAKDMNAL